MTTYVLDWSNPIKPTISLEEQTINITDTSLKLVGKYYPGYGELQQENLIKMLEHFSSDVPPAHPTEGQFWYDTSIYTMKMYTGTDWILATSGVEAGDTTPNNPSEGTLWYDTFNNALKVWDGVAWRQIYPLVDAGETIKVAYITEYNAMVGVVNQISGIPTGTTYTNAAGYGQTPFVFAASTLTNENWLQLLNRIKNIALHQGLASSVINSISSVGFIINNSETITEGIVTMLQEYVNTLAALNSFNTTRFQTNPLSLESSTPASGTKVKNTSWNGTITHEMVIAFQSVDAAKAHFNAGGKLMFNVTIPNSPSSLVNGEWDTMLASVGSVSLNAQTTTLSGTGALGTPAKGFYDLTTVYQTLFTRATSGANAQGNLKIEAKTEASGSAIRVLITASSAGVVTATTTSSLVLVKPSATYLNSPVLQYPSVSGGGTWDSSAPPSTVYRPVITTNATAMGGIMSSYTLTGGNPGTSIVAVGDNGNGIQTFNYVFNSVGVYSGGINFVATASGNYTWSFTFSDGYVITQTWMVTSGAAYCAGVSTSRTFIRSVSYPNAGSNKNTDPGAIYESTCMASTSTVQLQTGSIPSGMNLTVGSDNKVHLFGVPNSSGSFNGTAYVSFPSAAPVASAIAPFSVSVVDAVPPFAAIIESVGIVSNAPGQSGGRAWMFAGSVQGQSSTGSTSTPNPPSIAWSQTAGSYSFGSNFTNTGTALYLFLPASGTGNATVSITFNTYIAAGPNGDPVGGTTPSLFTTTRTFSITW